MAHATVKIAPGVNVTDTPVLNEAGISQSQLIRFIADSKLGALPQKLGGWTQYPSTSVSLPAIARALWAWEDINVTPHLAFGTQNLPSTTTANLSVITNGAAADITPRYSTDSISPSFSTTSGSSYVTITDTTTTGVTQYDAVYITTQVSVGGVVLFGMYTCDPNGFIGATSYTVQSVDTLGNALAATSSSTSPVLPQFSTISGQSLVTVNFPNHGYTAGSTFPVLVSTTVGGATFYGNYIVQSVTSSSAFTINATTTPSATTTGYLNGGNVKFVYSYGIGTIPAGTGYGVGGYGVGGYGTGAAVVPSTGTKISATDWSLDNWGGVLLASPSGSSISPTFQPIYQYDPLSGSPTATVIPNAPVINDGFFVAMPQRQIIAWGSSFNGIQDPLLVRWCDVSNYNSWVAQVTNQAGSYRIPKGSKIVGGLQGPQQGIIWTDIGVWSMQYISQPYVYGFNEIGTGCGLIARKAAATLAGAVYWMGASQFFVLSGSGVQPIPCSVWDTIFQDLDQNNLQKIRVAVNSRFNEITWYFPTVSSGGEVSAYAKYNPTLGVWDYGNLARSAWIDQSILGAPIGADPTNLALYQHETSTDAGANAMNPSFTTGWFSIGDGENMTYVDQIWPDMKWGYFNGAQNATVNITFNVTDYPGQAPRVYGPYAVTQSTTFISPRFRGRLVSFNVSSDDFGSFWRLGGIRYRWAPDGKF